MILNLYYFLLFTYDKKQIYENYVKNLNEI